LFGICSCNGNSLFCYATRALPSTRRTTRNQRVRDQNINGTVLGELSNAPPRSARAPLFSQIICPLLHVARHAQYAVGTSSRRIGLYRSCGTSEALQKVLEIAPHRIPLITPGIDATIGARGPLLPFRNLVDGAVPACSAHLAGLGSAACV
jgi:hypothetical protein